MVEIFLYTTFSYLINSNGPSASRKMCGASAFISSNLNKIRRDRCFCVTCISSVLKHNSYTEKYIHIFHYFCKICLSLPDCLASTKFVLFALRSKQCSGATHVQARVHAEEMKRQGLFTFIKYQLFSKHIFCRGLLQKLAVKSVTCQA